MEITLTFKLIFKDNIELTLRDRPNFDAVPISRGGIQSIAFIGWNGEGWVRVSISQGILGWIPISWLTQVIPLFPKSDLGLNDLTVMIGKLPVYLAVD